MPMTMEEMCEYATAALTAYKKAKGEDFIDLADHAEISDLICDLLNLAISRGFQKDAVLETALMHHEGEQKYYKAI